MLTFGCCDKPSSHALQLERAWSTEEVQRLLRTQDSFQFDCGFSNLTGDGIINTFFSMYTTKLFYTTPTCICVCKCMK